MKILVTGGSGFIGTRLIERLGSHDVVSIDSNTPVKKGGYRADVSDSIALDKIFAAEKPEYVFHLAAHVNPRISMGNPSVDVKANIFGTMSVLEMCRKHSVKKIIFSSTAAVYGEPKRIPVDEEHETLPLSIYGASKLAAEKYIKMYHNAYGIGYAVLRYANVYGPGSRSVISTFAELVKQNKSPIIFGDGSQTRDYIYIDDIVTATIKSMEISDSVLINVSTGNEVSTNDVWKMVSKGTRTVKPQYMPEKKGEIKRIALDNSLAKKLLKWKPEIGISEGIRRAVKTSGI